ncbi:MAG: hypothetical protein Q8R60_17335 [Mycobacteriales bacterium]|nr:hypothetical protein [Mycobacteriales bacterium]
MSQTISGSPVTTGVDGPPSVRPDSSPGAGARAGPTVASGQLSIGQSARSGHSRHSDGARFSTCQREKP